MKKRNLRPQQTAPVARETKTSSNCSQGEKGIGASFTDEWVFGGDYNPFAGDDAE